MKTVALPDELRRLAAERDEARADAARLSTEAQRLLQRVHALESEQVALRAVAVVARVIVATGRAERHADHAAGADDLDVPGWIFDDLAPVVDALPQA